MLWAFVEEVGWGVVVGLGGVVREGWAGLEGEGSLPEDDVEDPDDLFDEMVVVVVVDVVEVDEP